MATVRIPSVARKLLLALTVCAAAGATGCMTESANISRPGTIDVQRRRAVRLDPYPDNNIAPKIVGGRPRDFQYDRSETDRARLLREAWWGYPF